MKSIEEINKEYVESFEFLQYVLKENIAFNNPELREDLLTVLGERLNTLAWALGKDLIKIDLKK